MYTKTIKIKSYDVDNKNTAKISSLMKHFQQIARENLDEFGMSYRYLLERNMVFVLTKYKIKLHEPMLGDDEFVFKTSPCAIHGVSFIRDFVIEDKNGKRLVEASSSWVIIDFAKRTILRPNRLPDPIIADDKLVDFSPDRTNVPEDTSYIYNTKVTYSLLDSNNHLNNCNYADIVLDGICEHDGNIPNIIEMDMSFEHEAKLGDSLSVHFSRDDSHYYAKCLNKTTENVCFTAVLTIA